MADAMDGVSDDAESLLGIGALRTYWSAHLAPGSVAPLPHDLEKTLLAGLGLNVLETLRYLHHQRPTYAAFEAWVAARSDAASRDRLRRALKGEAVGSIVRDIDRVAGLTDDDLAHWHENGYVILRQAIDEAAAQASERAVYDHLGATPDDPESWYGASRGHSIWVPLLRHPALAANRLAPRIHKAHAQLWGRDDLWVTLDQAGFNPPERPGWPFPGPHLHWDTTLAEPHPLDVQGILYLADVGEHQGAFSCVPGFHRHLKDWLATVPPGVSAQDHARRTLTLTPIAAKRGDMIIWHHLLPHGSSPNRASVPRVVQYLSLRPTRFAHTHAWKG
ncbi:phytanoyl-CoA dioxygenase family protein [Luteibacter sahnii]|uniref:phytanoyl-CoA dioxygenase family protein n=1 Tax=Luteibacter sahnii TaxID=3021977 RepID=UPI002A75A593|nr:phytanoyl-CoA dioxygenase family protein [Luteibacter sp. PPL193]MDY1550190.1 phytanoyl-CoA dioxygenase family protein [Luteibacter sp. PPL193]